jgi:hypothetical protein
LVLKFVFFKSQNALATYRGRAHIGNNMPKKIPYCWTISMVFTAALFISGCRTSNTPPPQENTLTPATTQSAPVASAETNPPPALVFTNGAYRIKAGRDASFTDSQGNTWQPDQGFSGGDVAERDADTKITNTMDPDMFMTEHFGMDSFAGQVPNGNYTANLYFAETYDGIEGPGGRVFSFNVQGHEFKDFDVWVKAGGPYRPYVVTVPVTVTNGIFRIDFTTQSDNPEINAIELIPGS